MDVTLVLLAKQSTLLKDQNGRLNDDYDEDDDDDKKVEEERAEVQQQAKENQAEVTKKLAPLLNSFAVSSLTNHSMNSC